MLCLSDQKFALTKNFLWILSLFNTVIIVHFRRNEGSSLRNSAVPSFTKSFPLWCKLSSYNASYMAAGCPIFVFLKFFFDSQILRMINDIWDTDLGSGFHSWGWLCFMLLNLFFQFWLTFVGLLELTLAKLKLTSELLNFGLDSRVLSICNNVWAIYCFVYCLCDLMFGFQVKGLAWCWSSYLWLIYLLSLL